MDNLKKNFDVLKIFIIFLISALFCTLIILFTLNLLEKNKSNYIKGITREQEILAGSTAEAAIQILNNSTDTTPSDNSVVNNILKKADSSSSRYWFFGTDNSIIFFADDNYTSEINNMTFEELFYRFKLSGGTGIQKFISLINNRTNGSVLFSESDISPVFLASVNFFTVNNIDFILGVSTSEDYLLRRGDIYKNNNYIIMTVIFLCSVLMILTVFFTLNMYRRNKTIVSNIIEIKNKNLLIENLSQKNSQENTSCIYDDLTELYNKAFWDRTIIKINDMNLLNTAIILIKIINIYETRAEMWNDFLKKISLYLKSVISKNDILVRIDNYYFAIIVLNTNKEIINQISEQIFSGLIENFKEIKIEIYSDIKTEQNQNLTEIFNNLKKDGEANALQ